MKKHTRLAVILCVTFAVSFMVSMPDTDAPSTQVLEDLLEVPTSEESHHTVDRLGLKWENRLSYRHNHLLKEENFREGKLYGLQKQYHDSKLSRLAWVYGTKPSNAVYVAYKDGEVSEIRCKPGFKTGNDQLDDACGFQRPMTYKLRTRHSSFENTYKDGTIIASKTYHSNGELWIDSYKKDDQEFSKVYSNTGQLFSEQVVNHKDASTVEKVYLRPGIIEIKKLGYSKDATKGEISLFENEQLVSEWFYEFGQSTNGKIVCKLKRSMASQSKLRPNSCPDEASQL